MKADEFDDSTPLDDPPADEMQEMDPALLASAKPKVSRGQMGMLAVVLAAAAGVGFMYMKGGPSSASAATVADPHSATAAINDFLSADANTAQLMQQTLKDTEKVVQKFRTYPGKTQVPLSDLKINPFRLSMTVAHVVEAPPDDSAIRRRHEEERQQILSSVQSLQLQTIMHGGTRKSCMINNTLYIEGQDADGFLIEQIAPSAVVVRKGVYRFELRMTGAQK